MALNNPPRPSALSSEVRSLTRDAAGRFAPTCSADEARVLRRSAAFLATLRAKALAAAPCSDPYSPLWDTFLALDAAL